MHQKYEDRFKGLSPSDFEGLATRVHAYLTLSNVAYSCARVLTYILPNIQIRIPSIPMFAMDTIDKTREVGRR